MTTQQPDTKVESETPHDGTAIINRWRGMNVKISRYLYQSPAAVAQLCEMIDEALRNEREACAKVADFHNDNVPRPTLPLNKPATMGYRLASHKIANEIRERR